MLTTVVGGFFGSPASRLLISALAGLAAGALAVSLAIVFGKRQAALERRLAGYELPEFANRPDSDAGSAPDGVVAQAVEMTERLAAQTGLLKKTEDWLEQADLPLRPAEVLFYVPVFAVIAFIAAALVWDPITGLIVAAIAFAAPFGYLAYRRQQRLTEFERHLPETLQLLAGAMRAGFSFMQGLETVANEAHGVMRRELQRVFTEARLGRPVEDALGETAARMDSRDLEWAVMAISIQREVGGNLAELLDTVADTMTKRERLRREIKTLTAEGRFSGIIVSAFPPVFGTFLYLTNRSYITQLFHDSMGIIALVGAGVMSIVGWFWLRKIVDIEV